MSLSTQVLYATVPSKPEQVEQLLLTLGEAQQRRTLHFRPRRKAQFVSGRALIVRYLDSVDASNYNIEERDNGGPVLTIDQHIKHISVSHTRDLVAVAFSCRPVGLDLEVVREGWSPEKAGLFCTEAELKMGLAMEFDEQNEFFTQCWVRKEAFSKRHELSVWSKRTRMTCLLNDKSVCDFTLTSSENAFALHVAALYGDDDFQLRAINF